VTKLMAHHNWSVQDDENRFGELVETARRKPQTSTGQASGGRCCSRRIRTSERPRSGTGTPSFAELLLASGAFFPRDRIAPTHESAHSGWMVPMILCLIVCAMPLAIGVFAAFNAWSERRAISTKRHRLNAADAAGLDDDDTIFRIRQS
jgi:hypothetical protein